MEDVPNPGSDEAIKQGCTCPVMDNHYGKGFLWGKKTCFWYTENCPLHVITKLEREDLNNPSL